MAVLSIELFGKFGVSVDGRAVDAATWHRRKPAALIKLLALAPGHRMHREQLADHLWPELAAGAAAANLRKALHEARQAIEPATVESDAAVLWLPADATVDVIEFRRHLAQARRTGDPAGYRTALELYREGLLPEDQYEEWAATPADELRTEYLAAAEEFAGLLEANGDLVEAIDVTRRLVDADPLREDNHTSLIRLNALAGRRGDALRAYDRLVIVLDEELGTDPGPDAQRLYEELRSRTALEPDLTADLWQRVGDLRLVAGDAAGAAKAYLTAIEADPGSGELERKCAEAWLMAHKPDRADPHLTRAERAVSDPAERGRLMRARSNQAWESGDIASAQQFAEQARDIAAEHGTADDLAAAHEALAIVSHFKGEWRDGLTSVLGAMAVAEEATPQRFARVFDIHHCIGQYHLYGDGLHESVEPYARALLDRAEEAGAVRAQAFAWCLLGESLLLQARWDEADGCLERSCELHASLGSRSGGLAWQRRAELAACRGDYANVEPLLLRASSVATVSVMARHLWGRIHATRAFAALAQGDAGAAAQSVSAAAASAARYGDCPTCSALLNPVAAEAFAQLGDAPNARSYADAAAGVAGMFTSSAWGAMAQSASSSACLAEGDLEASNAHAERAAAMYVTAGQPYWAAHAGNAAGTRVS